MYTGVLRDGQVCLHTRFVKQYWDALIAPMPIPDGNSVVRIRGAGRGGGRRGHHGDCYWVPTSEETGDVGTFVRDTPTGGISCVSSGHVGVPCHHVQQVRAALQRSSHCATRAHRTLAPPAAAEPPAPAPAPANVLQWHMPSTEAEACAQTRLKTAPDLVLGQGLRPAMPAMPML